MKAPRLFLALMLAASLCQAEDPATFDVGPFKFTRPATWGWVPVNSPMRKAQLSVPGKDGSAPAEITFFSFGSAAGGIEANVQRWLRQFESKPGAEKTEAKELSGVKVTLVSTEGTFNSGMPGGPTAPMKDFALRGAILDAGAELIFVKMTGPSTLLKESDKQFADFIAAAAASKGK